MNRLSKVFYIASTVGGFTSGFILTIVGSILYFTGLAMIGFPLVLIAIPIYIYSFAIWNLLIYRMWQSIQDGYARTTPSKAVGFLFVPYFNYYWIFQAIWGFAQDCNQYIKRHQVAVRKLPEGFSWAFCMVSFFWFLVLPIIVDLIIGAFLINRICDTVNQLPQPHVEFY
jgi:hypothetical protein